MGRDVSLGCYADWLTTELASAVNRLGCLRMLVVAFSERRLSPTLQDYATSLIWPRLRRRLKWLSGDAGTLLGSEFFRGELERFDQRYAKMLSGLDKTVFVWSGMSRRTIERTKSLGARSILVTGSAHIREQQSVRQLVLGSDDKFLSSWPELFEHEYDAADKILVESSYVKESLIARNVAQGKIFVLPPPVSVMTVKTTYCNKLIFGSIQLGPLKGTHLLLSWWRSLGLHNSELWLLGHWDSQLGDPPGSDTSIRYLGFLTGKALHEAMQQIDVAVFPTYQDGGPRSLFSLMASGACPITSEYCAGSDHIREGSSGFVVPLGDEDMWLRVLEWCSKHATETRDMGRRAQEYVAGNLNNDTYPSRLMNIMSSTVTI